MKPFSQFFLLVVSVIMGTTPTIAQWIQTNGPYGGGVNDFITIDSILITTNAASVFRSTNDGASWTQVSTNVPGFYNMQSFAKIGMNFLVGTQGGGVFRSTDGGISWISANDGLTNIHVKRLAVLGDKLFAATLGGGIYLSTDSGTSWSPINIGLADLRVTALAVSGANLLAGTSSGIFRSTDNGTAWTKADSGLPNPSGNVISFCFSDTSILCGISNNGLFRSSDNCRSWIKVDSSDPFRNVHALFAYDSTLFAGTYHFGVLRSTDAGTSWTPANAGLMDFYIGCFGSSGSYLFAGCAYGGAYRSSDNGLNWTQTNSGMYLPINCVAVNGTSLYAGAGGGGGVFLTTDNGITWAPLSGYYSGLACGNIDALAVTDSTLFASNKGSGEYGPAGSVWLSNDKGKNWIQVNSNLPNTNVACLCVLNGNVFCGTVGSGIFRSVNSGTSWTLMSTGLTNDTVWALAVSDKNMFAGTQDGLFLSADSGNSWTKIDIHVNSGVNFKSVGTLAVKGDTLFACTDRGDYFSIDNGTNWSSMPGQSMMNILGLVASQRTLFAGTSLGVWKASMSQITGVEISNRVSPTAYSLDQNYPNPFNPSTTIHYALPQRSHVTLTIFNTLGQKVTELVNGEKDAGLYDVTLDASRLASGVYLYRMTAGSYTETKKLVLIK